MNHLRIGELVTAMPNPEPLRGVPTDVRRRLGKPLQNIKGNFRPGRRQRESGIKFTEYSPGPGMSQGVAFGVKA